MDPRVLALRLDHCHEHLHLLIRPPKHAREDRHHKRSKTFRILQVVPRADVFLFFASRFKSGIYDNQFMV